MGLDDGAADRKAYAQARAHAAALGGDERLEHPRRDLRIDAGTRILDRDDELAGFRPKDGVASLAHVPAIDAFLRSQGVDARDKRGHDDG
ncbi:MAG: hypothetical protein K2Y27_22285 [Xanthobacteraceae bacterium]|nr:hypothetical protein [Xanthobacteraceae bacterium]